MFRNYRPVWAEVNLDNLAYNMRNIKAQTMTKEIFGVVKADAYGHGALEVSKVLLENGATRLSVAVLSEGIELRKGGITCPINILGVTPSTLFPDLIGYSLEPVVFSYEYAKSLSEYANSKNKKVKVHLAVDSGMGRIGFLPTEHNVEEAVKISKISNIEIESVFSHFSTADEKDKKYSKFQFDKYRWFVNELKEKGLNIKIRDISNSAAIVDLPETYCDGVRPGIILYGYYPSDEVDKSRLDIKPVMTLKASVVYLKTLNEGQYVGYGRRFKTERRTVIATLPVGYADGYTRILSGKLKVIINGKLAPVIGNICMDQCMIDVTDIEDVKIGDEVILMGSDGKVKFDAEDIAKLLGTISYEVLCMVNKRVPRVYIKNGHVIKVKNYI
ncbi:alanine racemase [Clostridium ljungdahlii]|uniref:Alanine racemase n=1 Tax=Clostridium ljungdahlii (strain ATCC 55383 / DSM 13528 / PETC) TaxID=748727 RepID=D8GRD1_CLOLD|nr:alanine racemase [Clostridium ljungdahlii]ADK14269.1 alanine racemase [Clostridium ljungdahlii DSM 13528]OAA88309.1 Alanine racemase [Clostridium ljungdahlii DSM 13528]